MAEKKQVTPEEAAAWYSEKHDLYQGFGKRVRDLLENLLESDKLLYQSITFRTKARDSFLKKYKDKEYDSPEEITDVAGLRIIAYTTEDVKKICALIRREFYIDEDNSVNKAEKMESNEVGYLSVHYIVSFNASRSELGEYKPYKDLKCEIQVRTLLQHAWAEIEHDRNYKFGGELPKEIKRRFYLVAGTLELMDREFQSISDSIDAYAEQVAKDTEKGQLDAPIDSISVGEFMRQKFPKPKGRTEISAEVIQELQDMGVKTLADLEKLFVSWFEGEKKKECPSKSYIGILRSAMILCDAKQYFDQAWNNHWTVTYKNTEHYWQENGVDVDYFRDKIHIWADSPET